MRHAPYQLTRRAMYDLVWAKPMTKVAAAFGISDVALKKICDRHRVPASGRGYWARRESGLPVKQTRLYATDYPADEQVFIHGVTDHPAPAVREAIEAHRERPTLHPSPPKPMEPGPVEPLRTIHPSIAPTAQSLRRVKPGPDGSVSALSAGELLFDPEQDEGLNGPHAKMP